MNHSSPARAGYWRGDLLELGMRYAYVPEFLPLLMEYVGARPGMTILEAGCGSGFLARTIARSCERTSLVGLDTDPSMLAIASEFIARDSLTGRVELVQGDTYRLPFVDNRFDLVTSHRVL